MAISITTQVHDKETLARAVRLRDAAVKIRSLTEEWQSGVRVSSVQRGPFRIRYRDPALELPPHLTQANRPSPSGDARPAFELEIVSRKPLLRTEWDNDAIMLTLFKRGPWEREFLRLASSPSRIRR
jgi:hypothetical protein